MYASRDLMLILPPPLLAFATVCKHICLRFGCVEAGAD